MQFQANTARPAPTAEQLLSFERTYRITLPAEYISTLQIGNGAVPITAIFDQGKRERLVERMLCLLEDPSADEAYGWFDISVVMTQLDDRLIDDENLVGMNVIPFAALFAGDFVCLDYRNNTVPGIAVWEHESSRSFKPLLHRVAASFAEFDKMLRTKA